MKRGNSPGSYLPGRVLGIPRNAAAFGGNHLIHAARRNIELTVVVFNNNTYGMTGGQFSSTTPTGDLAAPRPTAASTRSLTFPPLRRWSARPTSCWR